MYKLTLAKWGPNPHYDPEKAEAAQRNNYFNGQYSVSPEIETRHLEVTVTDEEFLAIKKAVLEVA